MPDAPNGWVAWYRRVIDGRWHTEAEYETWDDADSDMAKFCRRKPYLSGVIMPVGQRPDKLPEVSTDGDQSP